LSAFKDVVPTKPPTFLPIPPNAFDQQWSDRPTETVAAGLRLVSDQDIQVARAQARRRANEAFPKLNANNPSEIIAWNDAFNDALMAHIIGYALCDPNDVNEGWDVIKAAPEDIPRLYMTSDGKKLVFDAYERMRIELDPTQREASDDEAELALALLLEHGDKLPRVQRMRVRRLLAFVLDELVKACPKGEPEPEPDPLLITP
jgi:hypothetical protein